MSFLPHLAAGCGRGAISGAEAHTWFPSPASYFCPTCLAPVMTFPASCSDTGELGMTISHTAGVASSTPWPPFPGLRPRKARGLLHREWDGQWAVAGFQRGRNWGNGLSSCWRERELAQLCQRRCGNKDRSFKYAFPLTQ